MIANSNKEEAGCDENEDYTTDDNVQKAREI
jgi:hypothetical protein